MSNDNLISGQGSQSRFSTSSHRVVLTENEKRKRGARGRRLLFAFSYEDIAIAAGVTVETVRTAVSKRLFDPSDIVSLTAWIADRRRFVSM